MAELTVKTAHHVGEEAGVGDRRAYLAIRRAGPGQEKPDCRKLGLGMARPDQKPDCRKLGLGGAGFFINRCFRTT